MLASIKFTELQKDLPIGGRGGSPPPDSFEIRTRFCNDDITFRLGVTSM